MTDQPSPTVCAWELGVRLREHREQLGMTAVAVGKEAQCTQGYISGVEAGKLKITAAKLGQLMAIYDLDEREKSELEHVRTAASQRGWWHKYAPLIRSDFVRFLGYEHGAEHCRAYDSELIHGLLQTEDYARAIINAGFPYTRLTEVDRRVKLRLTRQARLDCQSPLRLTAVMGEPALRWRVGSPEVMRAQLDHLVRVVEEKDHVDIRVLPFELGAHPAIGASFQILSFASLHLSDLVWQEVVTSTAIFDHPDTVTDFAVTFANTMDTALNPADSLDFIRRVSKEMR